MLNINSNSINVDSLAKCVVFNPDSGLGIELIKKLLGQNILVYIYVDIQAEASVLWQEQLISFEKNYNFKKFTHFENLEKEIHKYSSLDYIFYLPPNIKNLEDQIILLDKILDLSVKFWTKLLFASYESFNLDHILRFPLYKSLYSNSEIKYLFKINSDLQYFESLAIQKAKSLNLDFRVTRFAHLLGVDVYVNSLNFFSRLIRYSLKYHKIYLPNDGMSLLFPTSTADAAIGIIKAMFSQSSTAKIYGLVNETSISLLHLAYLIRDSLNIPIDINFVPQELENLDNNLSSEIIKSQKSLGWYPRSKIEKEIKRVIKNITENILIYKYPDVINNTSKKINIETKQTPEIIPKPQQKENLNFGLLSNSRINNSVINSYPISNISDITYDPKENVPLVSIKTQSPKVQPLSVKPRVVSKNVFSLKKLGVNIQNLRKIIIPMSIFIIIFVGFFSPNIILFLGNKVIDKNLNKIHSTIDLGQTAQVRNIIQKSQFLISLTQKSSDIVLWQENILGITFSRQNRIDLDVYLAMFNLYKRGAELLDKTYLLKQTVFGIESKNVEELNQSINTILSDINDQLGLWQAKSKNNFIKNHYISEMIEFKKEVGQAISIIPIISDILAFDSRKTIMILLQDNQELRPTGGYIDSIGLLSVEKGKILDYRTLNTFYSIDQKFQGSIKPPEEIEKYLGEKNWRLRDANFDPDFTKSAARSAWFLQKEMDQKVDMVIAVDLNFFKNILETTGDVFLPEFNENISSSNILERAILHSESSFFNKSKNISDSFIMKLSEAIYQRIKSLDSISSISLLNNIYKGLEEKSILLWIPDTSSYDYLDAMGFDGRIRVPPKKLVEFGNINISDYLAVFESNFGVNKVNHYIDRKISHSMNIDIKGRINIVSALNIINNSPSKAWPGGNYKNYLRFYLPKDVRFEKMLIKNNGNIRKVSSKNIVQETVGDKKSIGTLINIKPGDELNIEIYYQFNDKMTFNANKQVYSLYLQKQPGTYDTQTSVEINFPSNMSISKISPKGIISKNNVLFNQILNTDQVFAVEFLKK